MARSKSSLESIAMTILKAGQDFYTSKQDKDITAIASYYKKKIKTERLIMLNPQTMESKRVVRVIIL